MSLFPGKIIELTKDQTKDLGGGINAYLDDLESAYQQLFRDIEIWWKWIDAEPVSRRKDWPFRGASNVVVPLAGIMTDGLVARLYGGIFGAGKRIWSTFTENEGLEKQASAVARHLNWAARNDFNIRLPVHDWLYETAALGSSVLAGGWRNDIRTVFSHQGRGGSRRIVSREVSYARGVYFEHVPREQILWDTNHSIAEAPFVAREFRFSWSHIAHLARTNPGWDLEVVEGLRGRAGVNGPSATVQRQKDAADARSSSGLMDEHDIREVWMTWPILKELGFEWTPGKEDPETPSIPMVATIHRSSRQILQLKAAPYFWPGNPFFDGYIRKRSGRGHAVGLAKRLEHMQLALTTALNQALDARTRANSIWLATNVRANLNEPIDPSKPHFIHGPMEGLREMTLSTNNFQDLSLMQAVQTIAERLTGQADPNFGQDTRQGGHPSPATSTIALLQQGDQLSLPTRDLLRIQLANAGKFAATLYQQFDMDEDGRLRRIFGDRDAADLEQWLYPTEPIVGNIEFDLAAMSLSNSPQAEMNKAIQVTQMNTNYWAFIMRAAQGIQMAAQQPQLAQMLLPMAIKSIEAQTTAHIRFLEAADVDDIEKFVMEMKKGQDADAAQLQNIAGGFRELAGSRGAVAEPGLAGARRLAPGGASAPNGTGGFIQ